MTLIKMHDERALREAIVKSFAQEVSYVQGTFNHDDPEAQRRRWMSLHTVVGMLEHYTGLEGLHEAVGFRKSSLRDPHPFAGNHVEYEAAPHFKVWLVSAQEAAEADVPGPGWYWTRSNHRGEQTGRDWTGPFPTDEGAYLSAIGD